MWVPVYQKHFLSGLCQTYSQVRTGCCFANAAFLESYRPPLDGERYLTDGEVAELLRVSRRTLQEYRNNRVLPFILLGGKVLYPETGLREVLEANYRKPLE